MQRKVPDFHYICREVSLMFEIQDDRTAEQKTTHTWLVVGTDRFMGKWANDCGRFDGPSYAAWACEPEHRLDCLCWVERRGDMSRVREVYERSEFSGFKRYKPSGNGHVHIYVWSRS